MTSSGTYLFNPDISSAVLEAYERIGIRTPEITNDHMVSARMSCNLVLSSLSVLGVNLWKVDLQSIPLIQGTATYTVDPSTVMVLDAYITQTVGSQPVDRVITAISRTDYSALANKTNQGFPTVYWFDRLINPTMTLWQVPDATSTYTLNFYRVSQVQDANPQMGQTADIPYRFQEAWCASLAWHLARKWKPAIEAARKQDAIEAMSVAIADDSERVPFFMRPDLSGYFS